MGSRKGSRRTGLAPDEFRRVSIVESDTMGGLGDKRRSVVETHRHGGTWKITVDQITEDGESQRTVLTHKEAETIARHRQAIIKEGRVVRGQEQAVVRG